MKFKQTWNTLKLFWHLLQIGRNPQNTEAVFSIVDCLRKLNILGNMLVKVTSHSANRALIQSRYMMTRFDLNELIQLPSETLGYAYSNHMLTNKLDPDFYPLIDITDDATYIIMRLRQTHDLWHSLTGFNTTVPHELGLQAFVMAQLHTPLPAFLIGGRLLVAAFKDPSSAIETLEQVSRGWAMGTKAKPVFALDWEKNWKTPLNQLKNEYGL